MRSGINKSPTLKKDAKEMSPETELETHEQIPVVKEHISYDEIRKKAIFTYLTNESVLTKERIFGLDSNGH